MSRFFNTTGPCVPDERIFWRTVEDGGRTIHIVGA
jgi:hypothetical protein